MADATFADPDVTTFARLDGLGLRVTGQFLEPDRTVLECRVVGEDARCRRCGGVGVPRDSVTRRLAHEPMGWPPTILLVIVRRYRCGSCALVWRQDTTQMAEPRARLSRAALRWALQALVCQHLTVARIAEALAVAWDTANDAVLAEGRRVLIADPARFDGVKGDRGRRTRVAAHPQGRQVRHRDHRFDAGTRWHRPGPAAGHGRRPLQAGVQDLAGAAR
jgi:hypothetical protein